MKLEQTTLDDYLAPEQRGTAGVTERFVRLSPVRAWILRQLYLSGAMTAGEIVSRIPPENRNRWTKSGVTGRLSELTRPGLRLVESRYVEGHQHRLYAITMLGRRVVRGLPV